MEYTCQACGKTLKAKPSVAKQRKYCSLNCFGKSQGFKTGNEFKAKKSTKTTQLVAKNGLARLLDASDTVLKDEPKIDIEEQQRLRRAAYFKKHGQCVEVDKAGNSVYYDKNGEEIL